MGELSKRNEGTLREQTAWCLFDFANSPFPTIALTAFGAPFFEGVLVGDEGLFLFGAEVGPKTAWGLAISISMALVTLSSPVLGIFLDRTGRRKTLLGVYVFACVVATVGLGFVRPGQGMLAFILYIIANFTFEGAYVFYNAFLPDLAPPERIGRLSGYGWALGYVGGLLALIVAKFGIGLPDDYSPASAGGASNVYFLVAAWYALFALPALIWLRNDAPKPPAAPRRTSVLAATARDIKRSFRTIWAFPVVATFLAAYFLYNDALTTVIAFVTIFTKDVLEFTPGENIILFLVLNVIAAPGAILFGFLLDRIGGKRAIVLSLVLWSAVVVGSVVVATKTQFWGVAVLAAVVIGATQSSSRALMAKLAPRHRIGEFMGFLALSGKASAVLGPLVFGMVSDQLTPSLGAANANRVAVAVIGGFFVIALVIMTRVDEERGVEQARSESR